MGGMIVLSNITSPGHKLGQMIGNLFEEIFSSRLQRIADDLGFYLDKKGLRPGVRGSRKKVTWTDKQGNEHDLDYVFEKGGTKNRRGDPVAFIELAWRRYTKHSRNKAGEIEGALIHLGQTYPETCGFLGAILGGEFTEGAINQLESRGITILYIPYGRIVKSFSTKGVNLDYPEDVSSEEKRELIRSWQKLSDEDMHSVKKALTVSIHEDYSESERLLRRALKRRVDKIRILGLFGEETVFNSIEGALKSLKTYELTPRGNVRFQKFEIFIRFTNGDRVDASFHVRKDAMNFLKRFQ